MKPKKKLSIRQKKNTIVKSFFKVSLILLFCLNFRAKAQTVQNFDNFDRMLFSENYETAISIMDSVLQKEPQNTEAHYKIAIAYQNIYRHDKAIDHLTKARKLSENNIKIISALGKSYFSLGAYDKAQEAYEAVLLKDTMNINVAFSLARVFIEQEMYDKAISEYQKLILKDSLNSYIYKQLGFCYLKTNALLTSTMFYISAYKLNPSDLNIVLQLSVNCIKLDQLGNASQLVDKYLALYPTDARFIRLKGDILYKQKSYMNADTCYLKVLGMGDSSSYVYQKSGLCNYNYALNNDSLNANQKLKYFEKAVTSLEKAVQKDSSSPVPFMYLSLAYYKSGRFQDAISAMEGAKGLSISEIVPDICSYLGDYYKVSKQYNEALEEYKEALRYKPESRDLLISIGDLYFRHLKDDVSAFSYYEEYIKVCDSTEDPSLKKTTEYMITEQIIKHLKKNLSSKKGTPLKNESRITDRKSGDM